MNSEPPASPDDDPNLSDLGRAMLGGESAASRPSSKPSAVWEPPTADELHKLLPQYEIVKMLGRGGMGAVYMGRQISLDRPVAIKILSATLGAADVGFSERFKNEARAMAKLNHPGIVSVYDFGETEGGLLYIVMEYVDGTDVARMIAANGRLHTEHAMAITAHVCDALAYAHERGIIHRDIKPANIMVGYDGSVKVADFGLAKVSTANGSTMGLTQSGMAMGTLHFMAPEALVLGSSVDHRADIYAVGVMLYQMLTGKLPQGMFKMPSQIVSGLDPRYDEVIRHAIMEDRDERYPEVRNMRGALDRILTQPVVKVEERAKPALPTQARPQRPGDRQPQLQRSAPQPPPVTRRSLGWLWLALITLVVAAVWYFVSRQPASGGATTLEPASSPPPTAPRSSPPTSAGPGEPNVTIATSETKSLPVPVPTVAPAATEGWTSLFNGKDLTGWDLHPANFPAEVKDGAIRIRGSSTIPLSGNMYYRGTGSAMPQWTDFELVCSVKTENKGNSGIYLHASPSIPNSNRSNGVEVQIWNDLSGGTSGKSGSLHGLVPALSARFGDGEWFHLKARVEGKRVQTWLKKPSETEWQPAADWTPPAGWTPPTDRPGVKLGSGTISLQNNPPLDGVVWFKDVQFRELNAAASYALASVPLDEKQILGRWVRTNMDRPGDAYLMDLSADGSALWTGDNTTVRGTWLLKAGVLEVDWNSHFKFSLKPPSPSASPEMLKGTANWPDGKSSEIFYERQATSTNVTSTLDESFGGHRYQFVPGSFSWSEAKAKAESMGGHLTTITSQEENEWLLDTFKSQLSAEARPRNARMVWLGGIEENLGAGWKWVTGEPFQFNAWMPGEPNREKGGHGQIGHPFMLNFYSEGTKVGWNDNSADSMLASKMGGFLVEWETDKSGGVPTPAIPVASATSWTDTKGRSLQAKFIRTEGTNVMLEIAGKVTPVPLASLSSASQKVVRDLQASLPATTDVGWTPLFPNESLSGWTGATANCIVSGNILNSAGKGDLISAREYASFQLKFDLRISEGANNGIGIWRELSVDSLSGKGFEIQIQDDTWPEFQRQEYWQQHGGIYYYKEPLVPAMNPPGTWNSHEIHVEGTQLKVTINGKLVQDTDLSEIRPIVSRAAPFDASRRRGYLVIHGNRGVAEFRNIRIKELP